MNAWPIPFLQHAQTVHDEQKPGGFWDRVAELHDAARGDSVIVTVTLLILATVPYFGIKIGFSGVSTLPANFQSRQAFDRLEALFAGGQVYPAEVVIDGNPNTPQVQAAIEKLKALTAKDAVFGPSTFETNSAGNLGLLSIQLVADPNSQTATKAIKRLRNEYIPEAFNGVPTHVVVTGLAAGNLDFYDLTAKYTPYRLWLCPHPQFILLMMVFRSIVVPAKAIVMNLLSVGAAYGLLVLVFQDGVGNEIFGFQKIEAVEAWLPLFLFAILFGLSMDYHVFLLSRIKERYDLTHDNTAPSRPACGLPAA